MATVGGHFKNRDGLEVGENQLEIYPPDPQHFPFVLLRRVLEDGGPGGGLRLGPIWWATDEIPDGFANASRVRQLRHHFGTVSPPILSSNPPHTCPWTVFSVLPMLIGS